MAILHFSGKGVETAHRVFDILAVSSRDDPYLRAIAHDCRHCHGYGFVAALNDGRGWSVVYERFDAELFLAGEEACQHNLDALGEECHCIELVYSSVLGKFITSVLTCQKALDRRT